MTVQHCKIVFPEATFRKLEEHLFPGDHDEHGAIVAAGIEVVGGRMRLLARDVFPAKDGIDFVDGKDTYKTLKAEFIYPNFRYCRRERLAYLAVHNHGGSDEVQFSGDDLESHEANYPAMISLAEGLPVGALVFAQNAVAGDIWLSAAHRLRLSGADILGSNLRRLYPRQPRYAQKATAALEFYDRQVRFFGAKGQELLRNARVAVVGVGGAGSLIVQYLAHLGVGTIKVIDPDRISNSNLARVVGATRRDALYPLTSTIFPQQIRGLAERFSAKKVAISRRVAMNANPKCTFISISDDFGKDSTARAILDCDFAFLAADSMRARLVFNALVHQYFLPGIQVGAKISTNEETGHIENAFSAMRWLLPQVGCLWCSGFINSAQLAMEAKSDKDRKDQAYGTDSPNPSVITLNSVAAAHAVMEFQMWFLGLRREDAPLEWKRFRHLDGACITDLVSPDAGCAECQVSPESRYGRGDSAELPTALG